MGVGIDEDTCGGYITLAYGLRICYVSLWVKDLL